MNKTPTAEQFISQYWGVDDDFMGSVREQMSKMSGINFDNIPDLMIEFAKLHVEAALKAASENACVLFEKRTKTYSEYNKRFVVNGGDVYTVAKYNILKAYPQENIK